MATSSIWQLQDAKARLSELVQKTIDEGPQTISRRGKASVLVISVEELRRLRRQGNDLVAFLRTAPEIELAIERQRDTGRAVDL